ncbi:hypothetical protein MASR1M50_19200 [Burkholderiales bacterium]
MVTSFITEAGFIGSSGCQARRGGGSARLAAAGAGLASPLGLTGSGWRVTAPGGGGSGATTMATALAGTPALASAWAMSGGSAPWARAAGLSSAAASSRAAARRGTMAGKVWGTAASLCSGWLIWPVNRRSAPAS